MPAMPSSHRRTIDRPNHPMRTLGAAALGAALLTATLHLTSSSPVVAATAPTSTSPTTTAPLAVHINFQPAGTALYPGYLVDAGQRFGDRGNGYSYGWSGDDTANVHRRYSSLSPDARYDTVAYMQHDGVYSWSIALPNGRYTVAIVAGDPSATNSVYGITAQGATVVQGTPTTKARWVKGQTTVDVADGTLTLRNTSWAWNNKIDFVDITGVLVPTATPTNTPSPAPTNTATATNTPIPPTATMTQTPVPPMATATSTAAPPTATMTPVSPTATATPVLPTATATPLTGTVGVGASPWSMAIDPLTHRAFILGSPPMGVVTVMDTRSGATLASIATNMVIENPCCVTSTDFPHGRLMISSGYNTALIDTQQMRLVGVLKPSWGLALNAFDPASGHAFVAQREGSTIAIATEADGAVTGTIGTSYEPQAMGVYDGRLYVGGMYDGTIHVYDVASGAALGSIDTGVAYPVGVNHIVADAYTKRLYVAATDGRVVTIDPASGQVVGTAQTGGMPAALVTFDTFQPRVLVAGGASVTVLDGASGAVLNQTPLDFTAVSESIDPGTGKVIVAGQNSTGVERAAVLGAGAGQVLSAFTVPGNAGNLLLGLQPGQDSSPLWGPSVVGIDTGTPDAPAHAAFILAYGGSTMQALQLAP